MSPWPRIAKLAGRLATSRADQWRFAAAGWLAAPAIELCLTTVGLQRTLRWVEGTSRGPSSRACTRGQVSPEEGARIINALYRLHLLRGACLPRSLLQYWLHRRQGTSVRFVVGVRHPPQAAATLEAHAWVEPLDSTEPRRARAGAEGTFETLLVRESASPRCAEGQPA